MRAYTSAAEEVRVVARIDVNQLGAVFLRLADPLEGHGVVFRHVAAFDEDRLAILEVDPVIGHRSAMAQHPRLRRQLAHDR